MIMSTPMPTTNPIEPGAQGPAAAPMPGQRLRISQQVPRQNGPLRTVIEGTLVRIGQQKTGSWFAHSKDKKLWLDRLELRKDDGELVVLNLDHYTSIEILSQGPMWP
jgi:hypothetical protein